MIPASYNNNKNLSHLSYPIVKNELRNRDNNEIKNHWLWIYLRFYTYIFWLYLLVKWWNLFHSIVYCVYIFESSLHISISIISLNKSLKIPESVNRRMTNNTMAKRNHPKGQTTIYKILHWKLTIGETRTTLKSVLHFVPHDVRSKHLINYTNYYYTININFIICLL